MKYLAAILFLATLLLNVGVAARQKVPPEKSVQIKNNIFDNYTVRNFACPKNATECEQWHNQPAVVPAVKGEEAIVFGTTDPGLVKIFRKACEKSGQKWQDNPPGCLELQYHCADGDRVLLHSENGKRHVCLKLPAVVTP